MKLDPHCPPTPSARNAEIDRLEDDAQRRAHWKRWGPYLSERQWGTVREDYSEDGSAWDYFPHDHARSRAYRWGEDGLLGFCDHRARLCFALALWNGRDALLKERLFGLTGPQGNHGEDVKELYYFLDSTPTHSYAKALYRYPQSAFPYEELLEVNRTRTKHEPEYELVDTGALDEERYFDVQVEYAKADVDDIAVRITISNRGPAPAALQVLPQLWFRNTWSWGRDDEDDGPRPRLRAVGDEAVEGWRATLGQIHCIAGATEGVDGPHWVFTENETNVQRLFGVPNPQPYVKDAFHELVVHGRTDAVNPSREGSKAAARYSLELAPRSSVILRLRWRVGERLERGDLAAPFERLFEQRQREADEFHAASTPALLSEDERNVVRQAHAGLAWSKQFYHYVVRDWLAGDPGQPAPPDQRRRGRNSEWEHAHQRDVLSMPDTWEYPWFAAWDLAFHMIPLADVDPHFAKAQLELLLREWYMHPSGQIPAYEWAFSDVNPPVHAWACWRVYKKSARRGERDKRFLASCFQKLLLNFTWWVNRKDAQGRHVFSGGFLGMDNISVFDRSQPLPTGGSLEQADGTAWMAFYCGTMLAMALELAEGDRAYEDMASKFFEHYVHIADAMNRLGGHGLWSEDDGFYYDQVRLEHGPDVEHRVLRVRSMVGLIPLLAVEVLDDARIARLPQFKKRMEWFLRHRADLAGSITYLDRREEGGRALRLLSIPSRERLESMLRYLLDEREFLAPHGVRSVSRHHLEQPFVMKVGENEHRVDYAPGESLSGLFGGNSNWRGPIWFPINFLIVEALERYALFYGDDLTVELPTGSGRRVTLATAANEIAARLTRLFLRDERGERPCHAAEARYRENEHWRELVLFHEYFHGESGKGLGASHQTGWTALVASLLTGAGRARERERECERQARASAPAPRAAALARKR